MQKSKCCVASEGAGSWSVKGRGVGVWGVRAGGVAIK